MNTDDHRLIAGSLAGNPAAFGELVARYKDRLYNTVYRIVGNSEDAQDVVQDAFLNAYQSLASFKGDANFSTWIYRIAVNAAISVKRKRKAGLRLAQGTMPSIAGEPVDNSADANPSRRLELREEEERVQAALSQLTDEHRTVLVLKDIDGRKYEEMAEILGVPIGTIRSRLHRARLELRTLFLEQEPTSKHTTPPGRD